jgi:hypothetical protein
LIEARAAAVGARAAGLVLALGYLVGLADGPIAIVVGGLALVVLGRSPTGRWADVLFGAFALAVVGGALGIPALRWQVFDLSELRGVQAVLGPTVLVGPTPVAAAGWVAGGAALIALGTASSPAERGLGAWLWRLVELVVGAVAIVSVFYGPAIEGWGWVPDPGADLAGWAVASAAATAAAVLVSVAARRAPERVRWAILVAAAIAVAGSAIVIVGNLYR